MEEIEVKILDISKDKIEKKLKSLGAKRIFEGPMESVYFKPKEPNMGVMRLRKIGNTSFLTLKRNISKDKVKIADEHEMKVDDFSIARALLNEAGFREKRMVKKYRTSYKLRNAKVEIDTHFDDFFYIPTFLEIEAKSVDKIYSIAKLLGFSEEDCLPWGFGELVRHYEKSIKKKG